MGERSRQFFNARLLMGELVAILVGGLGILAIVIYVVGKPATSPPWASSAVPSDTTPSPSAPLPVQTPAPAPARSHNYALEEDGLYGYEPALSDTDRANGVAGKPIVMVKYLGERNGTYRVEIQHTSNSKGVLSCKLPCEYLKATTFEYGEPTATETIRTEGTLGGAILADAIAGELRPFKTTP